MQLKLTITTLAAWAFSMSPALAQNDSYCYDADQHPFKFSDLGSRLDITQALNETCESPTGDHMYACNAAVSVQARWMRMRGAKKEHRESHPHIPEYCPMPYESRSC